MFRGDCDMSVDQLHEACNPNVNANNWVPSPSTLCAGMDSSSPASRD